MPLSRRGFLGLTVRSAFLIGVGNSIQAFSYDQSPKFRKDDLSMRFAVVSDGHYGQADTAYDALHNKMVDWLVREKNQMGLSFTMINGDLFHDDPIFLPEIKMKFDALAMPYYVSHGNHDKINEDSWEKTWGTRWNYSFSQEDSAFLILNNSDMEGKYSCPDLDWTKNELSKYAPKKQLFVFIHITPFNWTNGGTACPELVDLFDRQDNLKAVFHGHDHDQDGMKLNKNKPYFFDSHIAGSWGTPYQGYRIIEILKTGEVLTYQMNPTSNLEVNRNYFKSA
jgi:Icc protein